MPNDEKIRWSPKVRQEKIWQLYQSDAGGIVDEALIDDVGLALLDRCQSVLMVSNGEVECPRCGCVFACVHTRPRHDDDAILCPTPGCDWQTTFKCWHDSWRHRELIGTRAFPVLQEFVECYERTVSPRERMVLIDQLIHAFHWDLRNPAANRSVANNLIEGSHNQVIAFLDRLSYGEGGTPMMAERKEQWREVSGRMMQFRRTGKG